MAYSDTLNLVVGDTLPVLTLTLKDSNQAAAGKTLDPNNSTTWAPINLAGSTVRMRIRELGGTTVKNTLTCTVTGDGTAGEVITDFPTGTLNASGTFEAERSLFQAGGYRQFMTL